MLIWFANVAEGSPCCTCLTEKKPIFLLWVWPENYKWDFSDCKTFYNIDGCHLTDDRKLFPSLENFFNLTLSYRCDADISVRNLNQQKSQTRNWSFLRKTSSSAGLGPTFTPVEDYYPTMASCKFYLSFENYVYKDYITETFSGPLSVGTVPVVVVIRSFV
uniref:Fucosyltransferase n=1 Tax=Pygocentrus nattereri TaxID=42514 RepID=A0AAR2KEP9_PYGNA